MKAQIKYVTSSQFELVKLVKSGAVSNNPTVDSQHSDSTQPEDQVTESDSTPSVEWDPNNDLLEGNFRGNDESVEDDITGGGDDEPLSDCNTQSVSLFHHVHNDDEHTNQDNSNISHVTSVHDTSSSPRPHVACDRKSSSHSVSQSYASRVYTHSNHSSRGHASGHKTQLATRNHHGHNKPQPSYSHSVTLAAAAKTRNHGDTGTSGRGISTGVPVGEASQQGWYTAVVMPHASELLNTTNKSKETRMVR